MVQCRQMETVPHSFMPDVQSAAAVVYRLSDKNDVSAGFLNFKQCHQPDDTGVSTFSKH